MVRQTRNIPQDKVDLVSQEEKQQAYDYQHVTDNFYHAGINVGKPGAYDPQAGADKHPIRRPESDPKPVLATDPGQPKGIKANELSRDRSAAVDTPAKVVLPSGKRSTKTS